MRVNFFAPITTRCSAVTSKTSRRYYLHHATTCFTRSIFKEQYRQKLASEPSCLSIKQRMEALYTTNRLVKAC